MSNKAQLFSANRWLFTSPRFLILGGVALILITGTTAIYFGGRASSGAADNTTNIPPEPIKVTALGKFEPAGEVVTVSVSSNSNNSDRIAQILVQEGSQVEAGQTIAVLNSVERLQAAFEEEKAKVYAAEARLAQVKAGAKQGDIVAQNARFEQTKAELEGQIITQQAAIHSLEAQLNGEKLAQQATIGSLEANLIDSQKNCQRYKTLAQQGAISEQEQDQFCLAAKTAENNLREGEANLQRIVTTGQEKIKEAEANLSRTRTTLDKQITENQATLSAISEVRPIDVQVAQADLITAQTAVKRAEADLKLAYIQAPISGEILEIMTKPGELIGTGGILKIGQTSQMYAVAEVYETDITKVKIGQKATVTSEAINEELHGEVVQIGRQVLQQNILDTDPTANSDARIVEVKIKLDPSSSEKVSGLTNQRIRAAIDL